MKRDMELVRKILLFLEDDKREYYDGEDSRYSLICIEGYSEEEIDYHLEIMRGGDIIQGELPGGDGRIITHSGVGLNWKGHDFIKTFGNEGYWNGTKKYIKDKGLEVANVPFDLLIETGRSYIRNLL